MALNLDEVRRIGALARLRLDPDEEVVVARQLAEIVAYVDRLADVPTGGLGAVRPAALREAADETREGPPGPPPRVLLANAPAVRDGFFVVPAVVTPSGETGSDGDG